MLKWVINVSPGCTRLKLQEILQWYLLGCWCVMVIEWLAWFVGLLDIVYFLYFIVCVVVARAYLCVCFFLFFFHVCNVYVSTFCILWPMASIVDFGFSGNPALLLLVLNCRDCCLFESNKYLLLLLLLPLLAYSWQRVSVMLGYSRPPIMRLCARKQCSLPGMLT